MEQVNGRRKENGLKIIRNVDKGTQHNRHRFLRKFLHLDQEQAEHKEAPGANCALKGNEVKEPQKKEGKVLNVTGGMTKSIF